MLWGGDAKNGDKAYQPVFPDLAEELAEWLRGKAKGEPIWPGQWHKNAAAMLRVDLAAARVPYNQRDGVLDFHALRGTFITGLARAGVHPKTAQILARHSSIELTMQVYTHLELAEVAAALPKAVLVCAPRAQTRDGKTGHFESLRVTSWRPHKPLRSKGLTKKVIVLPHGLEP